MANNNAIDQLRTEVEQNYRFKKGFYGYDKDSVNRYIEEMQKNNEQLLHNISEEKRILINKNKKLTENIEALKITINELENKIKSREMTQKKVEESVVEKLKESNESLLTENSKKELIIKELEEKNFAIRKNVDTYSGLLKELDKKLSKMLSDKIDECQDIIAAWEGQFDKTSSELKEMVK